jgi:hypothetical protein
MKFSWGHEEFLSTMLNGTNKTAVEASWPKKISAIVKRGLLEGVTPNVKQSIAIGVIAAFVADSQS